MDVRGALRIRFQIDSHWRTRWIKRERERAPPGPLLSYLANFVLRAAQPVLDFFFPFLRFEGFHPFPESRKRLKRHAYGGFSSTLVFPEIRSGP